MFSIKIHEVVVIFNVTNYELSELFLYSMCELIFDLRAVHSKYGDREIAWFRSFLITSELGGFTLHPVR